MVVVLWCRSILGLLVDVVVFKLYTQPDGSFILFLTLQLTVLVGCFHNQGFLGFTRNIFNIYA